MDYVGMQEAWPIDRQLGPETASSSQTQAGHRKVNYRRTTHPNCYA